MTTQKPVAVKPAAVEPPRRQIPPGIYPMADPLKPVIEEAKRKVESETQQEAALLTEETLKEIWEEMLSEDKEKAIDDTEKIRDILSGSKATVSEEERDVIELTMPGSYSEASIKPYMSQIMTYLRNRTGNPLLQMKTKVVKEDRERKIYGPKATYAEMLKINPRLEELHKIFGTLDY